MEALELDQRRKTPKVVPICHGSLLDEGHSQARDGNQQAALELYQAHLRAHPDDVQGWMSVSVMHRRMGELERAMVCLQRALRLNDQSAAVWSNLGSLWSELHQHEQARRCHRQALRLAPDALPIRLAQARSLNAASCFDEALDAADRCAAQVPGRVDIQLLRAELLFYLGRRSEAFAAFESRLMLPAADNASSSAPRWRGQTLAGRSVVVFAERGDGPSLLAARYLSRLADQGADISLVCDARLHPAFKALPVTLKDSKQLNEPPAGSDYHCYLLSLPGLFEPGARDVPDPVPVTVVPKQVLHYQALFGEPKRLRVGAVWGPGERNPYRDSRGFEFERLHRLAHEPGVQLVSLQRGRAAHELRSSDWGRQRTVDLNLMLQNYGETAAAICALDIVVTCDSVIAHLAGSLNKLVLLLLDYRPHPLWGLAADWTPWYPSMRILRQPEPGDWDSVLKEANALIGSMARTRIASHFGSMAE